MVVLDVLLDEDVLEPEPRRRIRPGGIYLFMMLAALFAYAIYTPSLWGMLVQLIRLLNDALGLTSVIVSHDVHETASIADYIYVIADGKVMGQGTPDEVLNSDDPRVRQFIRGLPDGPVPFHYPAPDYRADLLLGENR